MRTRAIFLLVALLIVPLSGLSAYVLHRMTGAIDHGDLTIKPDVVSLGSIESGTIVETRVDIVNRGDGVVRLLPPRAACGCIDAHLSQYEIFPGARAVLSFDFKAPHNPQDVNRKIKLVTVDELVSWTIPIRATIVADVWCSQPALTLELDNGAGATELFVHWVGRRQGITLTTASPEIEVTPTTVGEFTKGFEIMVSSETAGDGAIEITDAESGQSLKQIPVTWTPSPPFRVQPSVIRIPGKQGGINRTIMIVAEPERLAGGVQVVPLSPAVQVVATNSLNAYTMMSQIKIECSRLDNEVPSNLVEISVPGSKHKAVIESRWALDDVR